MHSRATHTIILVTFDCVARVDLQVRKSVRAMHCACVPRSPLADFAAAVRTGVGLGPAKLGKLYVLSDDVWAGEVALSGTLVAALQAEELASTLALQAESQSGISPFESRAGYAQVPSESGQPRWWVAQAESTQLEAVIAATGKAAGKLVALSSIAIYPPLQDADGNELGRTTSPQQCEQFAAAWLTRVLAQQETMALIELPEHIDAEWPRRAACAAMFAMLLMCIGAYVAGTRLLSRGQAELAELRTERVQLAAELDHREAFARRLHAAEQQHRAAEQARAERLAAVHRQQARHAAQRRRPVELLRALATTAAPEYCLQAIEFRDSEARVSGIATDSHAVTSFAQRLEFELGASQWTVHPEEISGHLSTPLIRFELRIVPCEPAESAINLAAKGVTDAR